MKPFSGWLSRNYFVAALGAIFVGAILLSRVTNYTEAAAPAHAELRIFSNIKEEFSEAEAKNLYRQTKRTIEEFRNQENPDLQNIVNRLVRVNEELCEAWPEIEKE